MHDHSSLVRLTGAHGPADMLSTENMSLTMMQDLCTQTSEYFYPLPLVPVSQEKSETSESEETGAAVSVDWAAKEDDEATLPAIPWAKPTEELVRQKGADAIDDNFVVVGRPRSDASSSVSKASTVLTQSRLAGTICKYLPDKKFGFISTAGGVEIFFHERHCMSPPVVGSSVSFHLRKEIQKGRKSAHNVREEDAPQGSVEQRKPRGKRG